MTLYQMNLTTCDILGGGGTCGESSDFSQSRNSWLNTFSTEGGSVLSTNGATVSVCSKGRAGGGTLYTGGGTGWGTGVEGITGRTGRETGGAEPNEGGMWLCGGGG
jgi:hypothetical protein